MSDYDGKADADYRDYCDDRLEDEMEELREQNAALRAEVERLRTTDWLVVADGLEAEVRRLRLEVERLREEQSLWRQRLRIASAKMDGQHAWRLSSSDWPPLVGPDADAVVRNALEAIRTQPLPAPTAE